MNTFFYVYIPLEIYYIQCVKNYKDNIVTVDIDEENLKTFQSVAHTDISFGFASCSLKIFIFILLKINIFLCILDRFDVLILKIIFKK